MAQGIDTPGSNNNVNYGSGSNVAGRDVNNLGSVHHHYNSPNPSFPTCPSSLKNYLNSQIRYARRGTDIQSRVRKLVNRHGRVFVPLAFSKEANEYDEWQSADSELGKDPDFSPQQRANKLAEPWALPESAPHLLDAVIKYESLVILGQPGSGKSSFLLHLLEFLTETKLGYFQSLEQNEQAHDPWGFNNKTGPLAELRRPVPRISGDNSGGTDAGVSHENSFVKVLECLPIYVRAVELADFSAQENNYSKREISAKLKELREVPEVDEDTLSNIAVLLLVDGLDEVSASERENLCGLIADCSDKCPQWRIIVTARPFAFLRDQERGISLLPYFDQVHIRAFSDAQIHSYVACWKERYGCKYPAGPEVAYGRLKELVNFLDQHRACNAQSLSLASNPRLLSQAAFAVCILDPQRSLQDSVTAVYGAVVDAMLSPDSKAAEGENWVQAGDLEARKQGLADLACEIHYRSEEPPDQLGDMPIGDVFEVLIRQQGSEEGWPYLAMIRHLEDRFDIVSEFYQPEVSRAFSFKYGSVQHYLSAYWFAAHLGTTNELATCLLRAPLHWREICLHAFTLLSSKQLSGDASALHDSVESRLAYKGEDELALNEELARAFVNDALPMVGETCTQVRREISNNTLALILGCCKSDAPAAERIKAAELLSDLGDPRFYPAPRSRSDPPMLPNDDAPLGFISVDGGFLTIFDNGQENEPRRTATVADFWIARWPVTAAQFRIFANDSGKYWRNHWPKSNHPATGVTWIDARDYCNWLDDWLWQHWLPQTQLTNTERELAESIQAHSLHIRLPTEPEWEMAIRGRDRRRFAFGDELTLENSSLNWQQANFGGIREVVVPVGCYSHWPNDLGIEDMTGNVWEWTCTPEFADSSVEGATLLQSELESWDESGDARRVLRGGPTRNGEPEEAASPFVSPAHQSENNFGFRIVLSSMM